MAHNCAPLLFIRKRYRSCLGTEQGATFGFKSIFVSCHPRTEKTAYFP